jgi:hypothetical protein
VCVQCLAVPVADVLDAGEDVLLAAIHASHAIAEAAVHALFAAVVAEILGVHVDEGFEIAPVVLVALNFDFHLMR